MEFTVNTYIKKSELPDLYVFRNQYNYTKITDLDIPTDDDEYVLVFTSDTDDSDEYINIYPTVRIIITERACMNNDKYKKLPINIDLIIINGRRYNCKDEFEMMDFMSESTFVEYVDSVIIPNEKYNEYNIHKETAIYIASKLNLFDIVEILLSVMDKRLLNMYNITDRKTVLHNCIMYRKKEIAINLISIVSDDVIENNKESILRYACDYRMIEVVYAIIQRINPEKLIIPDIYGKVPLFYILNYRNELIASEILKKLIRYNINMDFLNDLYDDQTLFYIACRQNMPSVVELMSNYITLEIFNHKTPFNKYNSLWYIDSYNMSSVKKILTDRHFI
jgi:ankyrin repeat protein